MREEGRDIKAENRKRTKEFPRFLNFLLQKQFWLPVHWHNHRYTSSMPFGVCVRVHSAYDSLSYVKVLHSIKPYS